MKVYELISILQEGGEEGKWSYDDEVYCTTGTWVPEVDKVAKVFKSTDYNGVMIDAI